MKIAYLTFAAFALISSTAAAQSLQPSNKVELEDVDIRGEAVRTNGLNLAARSRNTLDGRIMMRKDFKDRSLEDLPGFFNSSSLEATPSAAATTAAPGESQKKSNP